MMELMKILYLRGVIPEWEDNYISLTDIEKSSGEEKQKLEVKRGIYVTSALKEFPLILMGYTRERYDTLTESKCDTSRLFKYILEWGERQTDKRNEVEGMLCECLAINEPGQLFDHMERITLKFFGKKFTTFLREDIEYTEYADQYVDYPAKQKTDDKTKDKKNTEDSKYERLLNEISSLKDSLLVLTKQVNTIAKDRLMEKKNEIVSNNSTGDDKKSDDDENHVGKEQDKHIDENERPKTPSPSSDSESDSDSGFQYISSSDSDEDVLVIDGNIIIPAEIVYQADK